ncbi:MAG: carboxypeptidase-like regulatory domain-containing protein [bacterium]
MKKALTLKFIAVFIITFLFYKYNVTNTYADSRACSVGDCKCKSLSVTVSTGTTATPVIGATVSTVAVDDSTGGGVSSARTDSSGNALLDIRDIRGNIILFNITGPTTVTHDNYKTAIIALENVIQSRPKLTGSWSCSTTTTLTPLPTSPPIICNSGVSGIVVGTSGNRIKNALVKVTTIALPLETSTNSEGEWTISFHPLTVTGITISATGYQTVTLPPQCSTGIIELTSTTTSTTTTTATPLPDPIVPATLMGKVQNLAIAIGAIIAIIRIILGGLKLSGSGDNPIALEEGRDMITSSILGLLVILFAVTLLRVIGSSVLGIIK